MAREPVREEIIDLVDPGSMTMETILEELAADYSKREVQITLIDLLDEGVVEEHPQFDGAYRVTD